MKAKENQALRRNLFASAAKALSRRILFDINLMWKKEDGYYIFKSICRKEESSRFLRLEWEKVLHY